MRRILLAASCCCIATVAHASVFINEVFINPPGTFDDSREFIELMGTPGKKLDGYAVAVVNGMQTRFYPLGSIPPRPAAQEIDEFFSLDGLRLGPNGMLVISLGTLAAYPTMLPDTNHRRWNTIWNGLLDTPGKMENDGSNTILLIRNRPGATQTSHPIPPVIDLRWGKDIAHDDELVTPVIDPLDGLPRDQYGNGSIDQGETNGTGGFTLDLRGSSTPDDFSDDLEIVDEVSYEHDRGWEYQIDARQVDVGSSHAGLPQRDVHALDDGQGFNPDCLSRVDYRTKGPGWAPGGGGVGEMGNGNNWQDTATEQWVRGETLVGAGGAGGAPQFFFNNGANVNPAAIQPYMTNVPLWLADSVGADYSFAAADTYQIMAGRLNPLAKAYIPGDADRDGDADADDIARIAAVFGDPDWIFSNSFAEAPQGDSDDPATQTRPWDVDQTGDHGVEPSDLQWTLNFQGSLNGRIVGRTYDSTTPETSGVYLNNSLPVVCEVTTTANGNLLALGVNQEIEVTVHGRVSAGANAVAGQQNGIMQFVHDLTIATAGVARVVSVTPAAPFATTRGGLAQPAGTSGDLGYDDVNGYTTSFTQGLAAAAPLYRFTVRGVSAGSTQLAISAAQRTGFIAGTPGGLKVGHTNNDGNPGAAAYPVLSITVVNAGLPGDLNCDGAVTVSDIGGFVLALTNPAGYAAQFPSCNINNADINGDSAITVSDIGPFVQLLTGG